MRGPPPPPPGGAKKPIVRSTPAPTSGASLSEMLSKKKIGATTSSDTPGGYGGFNFFQEKSKTGLVGLSNQGATCYLNSLIQTLYMIPEFKHSLFNWTYDKATDGPEASSIPLQLQKLFGRLQLGEAATVETKDLTTSFGWRDVDAFRQHDIQELLCKLFEAMEMTFSYGNLADTNLSPISLLFSGLFSDYLQCDQGHKRIRNDPFFEIPLPVGGGIETLEESFAAWVTPEILESPWECGTCDAKVPATKGLKIYSSPQFLVIQLKRFTYEGFTRVKLNDKLSFSTSIDIKPYMDESSDQEDTQYDLFSVLVHSGGAQGGHYYAFVKNVITEKWYKFNDASVSEISTEEIQLMYGGQVNSNSAPNPTTLPSSHPKPPPKQMFSTSAYMLLYRKKGTLIPGKQSPELPVYIQEMIQKENQNYQKEREEYVQKRDNLALDVRFKENQFVVHIDKARNLKDALALSFKLAGLEGSHYNTNCVRLRKFNPTTGSMGKIFPAEALTKTLDELGVLKNTIMRLEVREPDEEFVVDSGEFKLQIITVNKDTLSFEKETQITIPNRECLLKDLRQILSTQFSVDSAKLRIAAVTPDGVVQFLGEEEKELQADYRLNDGNTLHVEITDDPSAPSSIIEKVFDQLNNTIQLQYNLIDSSASDQNISVDQRSTFFDFKQKIAGLLGVSSQEFKICKTPIGGEYKDYSKTLKELLLFDGQVLFIKKGEPLQANQMRASFILCEKESEIMKPLGDIVISQTIQISELRAMALTYAEIEKKTKEIKCLRLQLKRGTKMGQILFDGKSLQDYHQPSSDSTQLLVRVLESPDTIQEDQIIIDVQQWFPKTQDLTPLTETVVQKGITFGGLRVFLSRLHVEIPLESFLIARPLPFQLKNKNTLSALLNWYIDESIQIVDGDLIFFKDSRDPEIQIDGVQQQTGPPQAHNRVVEEGLKIFTIYNEEGRNAFQKRGILSQPDQQDEAPK